MSDMIEAKGLTKVYRRGSEDIYALRDVDLNVSEGEFVSIIGPSGSGKTALLNVLGCLDTPTTGSLRLNGIEISGLKEKDLVNLRRENIGFVFQQFYLIPTLTARENIELPLLFSRKNGSKRRIDEVLEMVGLGERGEHLPGQLSGGEMQRVAIGRALINEPRIILADEPTGNLDSATSKMIFELFQELNREGLTLVVVTHNLDLAEKGHKMYTLRDGHIVGCQDLAFCPGRSAGAKRSLLGGTQEHLGMT
jgi:putative ABC transport system ATP-binding protein